MYIIIGIGVFLLRLGICVWVARDMLKKNFSKWLVAIACLLLWFIPWLVLLYLIYFVITRGTTSKIRRLK